jgi:hypothetical protein
MKPLLSLQRVLDIDSGGAGADQEKLGHPDLKVKTGLTSHALSEDASNEDTLSSDPMEDEGVHPQQAGALLHPNTGTCASCVGTTPAGVPQHRACQMGPCKDWPVTSPRLTASF